LIGQTLVVDAVLHGFDYRPENMGGQTEPGRMWREAHLGLSASASKYSSYLLDAPRFERKISAAELVSTVFYESQTDIGVYHVVRRGLGRMTLGEWSSMEVALEMKRLVGSERLYIFGGLTDPFDTARSVDQIDQMIEEAGIVGLKLYPWELDGRSGRFRELLFSDETVTYPLLEHLRKRGINAVAIHKAMGSSIRAFGVADLDRVVIDFPDIQFEIVHGGWAFLEDTAVLATRPNVYINLESTASLVANAPRRFAEAIGRLLKSGAGEPNAEDRILWATGVSALHPQPLIEEFCKFQMPADLQEGFGYPALTDEIKQKILSGNFARKRGTTVEALRRGLPDDDIAKVQAGGHLRPAWSAIPSLDWFRS
jgi:predicted TIM-barrel fold metal-dependent hydrolase